MNQTIHVRIISPQELILDTDALSLSSKNSQGNFDILPQHANFITLIEKQPLSIRLLNHRRLTFGFPIAIVVAINNKINVYTYMQPEIEEK